MTARTIWPHTTLGSPTARPLVFLHGFLGRRQDWFAIAKPLSSDYFCILPDLPGHGEHIHRDPASVLTFARLSEELEGLLGTLTNQPATLIAYSLGGRLGLFTACRNPQIFSSLVLESVNPGIRDIENRRTRAALDQAHADKILAVGMASFLETWYAADLWASLQQQPLQLQILKSARMENDPIWMARVITDLSPGRMESLWECLPDLTIPVLMLAGIRDSKYTAILSEANQKAPNTRFVMVPEAGHNIHLEQPDRLLKILQTFLYNSI